MSNKKIGKLTFFVQNVFRSDADTNVFLISLKVLSFMRRQLNHNRTTTTTHPQPQHTHNHNTPTTTTQPQHNHNTTTTHPHPQPQHNHNRTQYISVIMSLKEERRGKSIVHSLINRPEGKV
jgi:hypothetical protein